MKYSFIKFERSKNPKFKYNAVLKHNPTMKEKKIPFGEKGTHYKDMTGLKIYAHQDNHDDELRKKWHIKNKGSINDSRKYSAKWFESRYLY